MNRDNDLPLVQPSNLVSRFCQERVLDRIADLLIDADEILEMVRAANRPELSWVEPHLQRVFDDVNTIMKRLCD
jgi:hypothetical protein